MTDVTFIIQGPYYSDHLRMIVELKQRGKVILSCYMSDYEKITSPHLYDSIILNDFPNCEGIYNYRNVYHQVRTTLRAVKHVETEYVVKFRGNAYFSNIKYIVDLIHTNPQKLTISPFHINPVWPYQLSDHIIGGTTKTIQSMFECANQMILQKDFIYGGVDSRLCAEVMMYIAFLKSKKHTFGKSLFDYYVTGDPIVDGRFMYTDGNIIVNVSDDYINTIINNIEIIDSKKLEPFLNKSNTDSRLNITSSSQVKYNTINSYIHAFIDTYKEYIT